ncbi:MAG: PhzF family phenazine biosynthesis protein [Chloroflexi bacterium]|nr:PhzF family phenazine biosynthesis protein [Chloroflexota bacterium]
MRKLHYHLVDVFTDQRFGGNPLAVFTNGRGLTTETMQAIAKEFNLSETTFVLPPEDPANDWRVRIFTPASELPMAGHPTVGTSFVLATEKLVDVSEQQPTIRLEELVGVIPVTFTFDGGQPVMATMQQLPPRFGPVFEDRRAVADMLCLDVSALDDGPVEVISCGTPFLLVPVKTLAAVQNIRLRIDIWERALANYESSKLFVFTRETIYPGSTVHSRMFAPSLGIREDPATGAASGPLGCYLVKYGWVKANPAVIVSEQGIEIGRPSFIHIRIEQTGGQINGVFVGGQCVYIGKGYIEVPL